MNSEQEDIFISTVLEHFDTIEKKSTNKSLTPRNLQKSVADAWTTIQNDFFSKTQVPHCQYKNVLI